MTHGDMAQPNAGDLLDAVRSSLIGTPEDFAFDVFHSFSADELTDPGESVHILTNVREPSGRYREGFLITVADRATTLLLAGSNGNVGYGKLYGENGPASEVGPRPGWTTEEEWARVAIETAVETLMRRNESRDPNFRSGRVRADQHTPLIEYQAHIGHPIRVRSWRLSDTIPAPDTENARIELWTGVLSDGLITYSQIAAGYREDGTIAALVCIEGMPSAHDEAFLGVFTPAGAHLNMGLTTPNIDLLETAAPILAPYLGEPPAS